MAAAVEVVAVVLAVAAAVLEWVAVAAECRVRQVECRDHRAERGHQLAVPRLSIVPAAVQPARRRELAAEHGLLFSQELAPVLDPEPVRALARRHFRQLVREQDLELVLVQASVTGLRRFRQLAPEPGLVLVPAQVSATAHQRFRQPAPEPGLVLVQVQVSVTALQLFPELDRGRVLALPPGSVLASVQELLLDLEEVFRGLAMGRLVPDFQMTVRDYRTAWRIVRRHWKIAAAV